MSDVVSFTEIDGQQVDLLPARTLLQFGGGSGSDGPVGLLGGLTGGGGDDSNNSGGGLLSGVTGSLSGLTGGA